MYPLYLYSVSVDYLVKNMGRGEAGINNSQNTGIEKGLKGKYYPPPPTHIEVLIQVSKSNLS
jgi:hypothetical protein